MNAHSGRLSISATYSIISDNAPIQDKATLDKNVIATIENAIVSIQNKHDGDETNNEEDV